MKISLIIPCRNEKGHIRDFLDSLLDQDLAPGWEIEVLIADGMSDDGTREVLCQYARKAPHLRVIDNPGRIVSTGLNAAIGAATGDIIIRMDAHTAYARNYIRECVYVLEESGADNVGGPWVAKGQGVVGEAIAAAFRLPFCVGGGKAHDPSYEGEVDTVYLGCWHRSVFDRVGLFDPALVRNQDDEFNFRLRRHGGRIWQSPRIQSSYTPRASIAALFRQYAQYGYWKVAVIRRHRALASWRHVVPALFVGWIAMSLLLAALGAWSGELAVAAVIGAALVAGLLAHWLASLASALWFADSLELPVILSVPGVIAVYHVAYGLGFLAAMLAPAARSPEGPPSRFFTALTR
jgi:succinoglycan biosynthesis protein ExoA